MKPLFLAAFAFALALLCAFLAYTPDDLSTPNPKVASAAEARVAVSSVRVSSFPLSRQDFQAYTSPFGWRIHPITRVRRFHSGLDIAAPQGAPVHAWVKGTVLDVRDSASGCGTEVWIQSGEWDYRYCHGIAGSVTVLRGERVEAGQVVMRVGATGSATGPHLHWETRYRERLIDPALVIEAERARKA